MIPFIQTTLDGLMVGSSYGLLALGFALIFGVMRRLNLSYGPSIMVGAYLGTLLYMQIGAPNGIVADYNVARFFTDAEALYSYEGTFQIQNLIVGKAITGFSAFV